MPTDSIVRGSPISSRSIASYATRTAASRATDDGGGIQAKCVETIDGELIVTIRTLTDEELDRLLHTQRRAPKRVH
jgi:hypothetical protein